MLKHKSGFSNPASNPGGATNKGITLATFRQYVKKNSTVADLKAITDAQVAQVYKAHHWDTGQLPSGVDYPLVDYAVNSGPGRAIKHLQKVVGLAEDSIIGPMTLSAVKATTPELVINKHSDERLAFLRSLSRWSTFSKGWTRHVAYVRTHALAMFMDDRLAPKPAPQPPAPSPAPKGSQAGLSAS